MSLIVVIWNGVKWVHRSPLALDIHKQIVRTQMPGCAIIHEQ